MKMEDLEQLEKESIERGIPIIGSKKGVWLLEKMKKTKPKNILELGTANGYSGCILGSKGAELLTIDLDAKTIEEAKTNFKKFGINAKIILGDGVEEVEKLVRKGEKFDFIFIDFEKKKYINVLENCIKLLRKNGLIIADNTSFPGCQDYKESVLKHPKLKTEIINIKDALTDMEDSMACSEVI